MRRGGNRQDRKTGVCVCVFMQNGRRVVLADTVLHLEEIASLAHLSPLHSAVISIAESNLADIMHKTLKLNSAAAVFFLVLGHEY